MATQDRYRYTQENAKLANFILETSYVKKIIKGTTRKLKGI
jgi:hypothetical protein